MIIRSYITHKINLTSVQTIFVLMLIIIGNTFVYLLGKVSYIGLPLDAFGKLIFLSSINKLIKVAPIACL